MKSDPAAALKDPFKNLQSRYPMNLRTTYLGLDLRSPLVASSSPLTHDLANFKKLEDAGVAAIVLHSLFQEHTVPTRANFEMGSSDGPDAYCERIADAKAAVTVPLVASINCVSVRDWPAFLGPIEQAGADALELNIYSLPTDPDLTASSIEESVIELFKEARKATGLPIALKLSPFYTNLSNVAMRLDAEGADALVLFNRFYQSDLHLDRGQMVPGLILSTSAETRLPLHWISLLYGRISADLAATSGIHTAGDCLKMVMAGADVTMVCSVLLESGIDHLRTMEKEMISWLQEHHFSSISQIKGLMSQEKTGDSGAVERARYFHNLTRDLPAFAHS